MPIVGLRKRSRRIEIDDIVRVGRDLGMQKLSLTAVAAELGVSATALYRHVDGRWGLELVVGESILADLELRTDPAHDLERHLLSFGLQIRDFVLDHPGLGTYMQTLFPRGDAGQRLLSRAVDDLVPFGYTLDTAVVIAGAVAGMSINYSVAEQAQRDRADGIDDRRQEVLDRLDSDAHLGEAHRELPMPDHTEYMKLILTAHIRGITSVAPPGRPLEQAIADLAATGLGV